eukprot:TRINITY_DN26340_c0_g1_i2.p1 TRINITY_DN26340_c0_g1~~TRINITY_DN26340_c0_g1_i2.p1  ORF type:complete len:278 (-),score=36.22 TRINITY_DN26340_c0_g1_i2:133-870(-)
MNKISSLLGQNQSKNNMVRLICISDTHNGYEKLTEKLIELHRSDSDILIHAGDMTDRGSTDELQRINSWFGTLPYKHKIAISGNMDGIGLQKMTHDQKQKLFSNVTYLENDEVELEGVKFFGTPYTPRFCGGFQLRDDKQAAQMWEKIPEDTQVLVVHGPPKGMMDMTSRGMMVGCPELKKKVDEMQDMRVMVWGHIHNAAGMVRDQQKNVTYINAAQYDGIYSGMKNIQPYVVEIEQPNRNIEQ